MRLCFVGDPRSIHTQRWVRWFAREHDVSFVATAEDDALADLQVCALPAAGRLPGWRLARSAWLVRRVAAAQRADVVHAHYINEPGWFAAGARRRPFVVTAWGSDIYRAPAESRLARRLNPWAVRAADWVTCDSEDQARVLRSWGVDRVSVIGWGVDTREFHPGVDGDGFRGELGIPVDAPVVLSPRQWVPNSNVPAVVAAHARLPGAVHLILKRWPRFDGGSDPEVERAIEASPARERIHLVGEVAASELPALYAAADVVVSLAATDGTPVSLLEAMAVGRPVVAFANPSVSEWVTEPGGVLVPTLDADAVAHALQRFLDRTERDAASAANVAVVAERADRATEMRRMSSVYEYLARNGGAGGR